MITRRGFLLGLGASAPAAIAASNLMKVKALATETVGVLDIETVPHCMMWTKRKAKTFLYGYMYGGGRDVWQPATCEAIEEAFKAKDPYQALADTWNRSIINART